MLTENDVIDAVVLYLKNRGWCIESVSYTNQRGSDVLAKKGKKSLAIEAKGGTSSKNYTARYKEPFNTGQKMDHVANALYKALSVVSCGNHRAGIALPSDTRHKKLIEEVKPALKTLDVVVFLVDSDGTVQKFQ